MSYDDWKTSEPDDQPCPGCGRNPCICQPDDQCRRCSECVGQDHHWMENPRFNQAGDPEYVCKHCEAACTGVDDDDGFMVPSGVLLAQPAICDECDEYVSGCLCDLDNGVDEPGNGDDCPECGQDIDDCECDALADYCEEP